jgi:putative addiction module component (TIGR02574 family)
MTGAAQRILDQALDLSHEERRHLAERLLESVEEGEQIEGAWTDEAIRRAEGVEDGKAKTIDGEEAVRQLKAKLRNAHRTP